MEITLENRSRQQVRLRFWQQKISYLSVLFIILASVLSLCNNTHLPHLHKYRNACVLPLTKTWCSNSDCNVDLVTDGFRASVCMMRKGNPKGQGVCFFINKWWCNNVAIREMT